MLDFELAEHTAFRTIFPNIILQGFPNIILQGCLFHYKQCLYRRFAGLAFVPVHDVQMTWNDLKLLLLRLFPTIIGPLVTYFEGTWIFGTYPLELGNVYNCTVLGDPRTNNNSEGGNNAINLCFGTSSPIMPKFVEKLQLYNCEQETKLEQLFQCRNPNRVPRTSKVIRQEDIRATVAGYSFDDRLRYCRTLGYLNS